MASMDATSSKKSTRPGKTAKKESEDIPKSNSAAELPAKATNDGEKHTGEAKQGVEGEEKGPHFKVYASIGDNGEVIHKCNDPRYYEMLRQEALEYDSEEEREERAMDGDESSSLGSVDGRPNWLKEVRIRRYKTKYPDHPLLQRYSELAERLTKLMFHTPRGTYSGGDLMELLRAHTEAEEAFLKMGDDNEPAKGDSDEDSLVSEFAAKLGA